MLIRQKSAHQITAIINHLLTGSRMLYDFFKYQNALRAESVHATYLVYGVKEPVPQPDVDTEMGSSQPEAFTENVPTLTMTLVSDDTLKGLRKFLRQTTTPLTISLKKPSPNIAKSQLSTFTAWLPIPKGISCCWRMWPSQFPSTPQARMLLPCLRSTVPSTTLSPGGEIARRTLLRQHLYQLLLRSQSLPPVLPLTLPLPLPQLL